MTAHDQTDDQTEDRGHRGDQPDQPDDRHLLDVQDEVDAPAGEHPGTEVDAPDTEVEAPDTGAATPGEGAEPEQDALPAEAAALPQVVAPETDADEVAGPVEGAVDEVVAAPQAVAPDGSDELTETEPEQTPAAEPTPGADGDAPSAQGAPAEEDGSASPAARATRATPRPRPGPRPGPGRRPAPPRTGRLTGSEPQPSAADEAAAVEAGAWGRVEDDGSVYVRTAEGERLVGQYAAGSPDEALAFYVRRYLTLVSEVDLVVRRVRSGSSSAEEGRTAVAKAREEVTDAAAVGDLAALLTRLDDLTAVIDAQRAAKKAERAKRVEEARVRKEALVGEAEKLAAGRDWRNGADRLRELLEEWKALPRLDRPSDDALWHRFSGARTTYTRTRKAHFADLDQRHGAAKAAKQLLIKEAEALSDSTDWGPTSGKYRDLMTRWKEAGSAKKSDDDSLWRRFRAAQDTFFKARDAANSAQDEEFEANAAVKDALLVEAQALLPIKNLDATKRAFRDIGERWEAAGKVPRGRMKDLEAGIRKVEQAVRGAEDAKWTRTDPEKSARADDMITKLEKAIADLDAKLAAARESGDDRAVTQLESDRAGRQMFLDAARRTAADLG